MNTQLSSNTDGLAPPKIWFTITDLVDRWQMGRSTIYKMVADGKLPPAIKFGRGSRWPMADVIAFEAGLSRGGFDA
jgi:excisionase family DNA binding protein